jgi:hypothetical protein
MIRYVLPIPDPGVKKAPDPQRWLFAVRYTMCAQVRNLPVLIFKQGCGSLSIWIRIKLSCWIRFYIIRIRIQDPVPDPNFCKCWTDMDSDPH